MSAGSGPELGQVLADVLSTSSSELFDALGIGLRQEVPTEAWSDGGLASGVVVAFLGFTGKQLHGTLVLGLQQSMADELVRRLGVTSSRAMVRDVAAEQANQLLGRIKHKLLPYGAELELSTPNAIFCDRVSILSTPTGRHRALAGATSYGLLGIWLDVEPCEGFVLRPPAEVEVPPEGDVMLF